MAQVTHLSANKPTKCTTNISCINMTSLLLRLKRSITARLLAVFIITSVLLIAMLFVIIAHGFAQQWRMNARPHLEQYLDFISAEIGNPPNIENARALADRLSVNIYINGPETNYSTNGEVLEFDENSFYESDRYDNASKRRRHVPGNIEFSGDENRTLLKSTVGDYHVFYELAHQNNRNQRDSFILPALLAVLGVLTVCFLVIRRMLRPVRDIKYGVSQMGNGDLTHRVPVRHDNDLGELAISINTMAADIEQMLDAKRQLLLGASHELRSPLTRAKIATQLLDKSKERQLIEDDLREMESLISDILESERMKSGHSALQRQSINLQHLVQAVIEETQADYITIECVDTLPLIELDETRIRILLRNLIGNAIVHHDSNHHPITVNLHCVESTMHISVCDRGAGIPTEHIDHVTEPFYRTDASRTRSTGGFGLGLHLAKLIAEAHGGTLRIESQTTATIHPDELTGTCVFVELRV